MFFKQALAEILNFQGANPILGMGSLSRKE